MKEPEAPYGGYRIAPDLGSVRRDGKLILFNPRDVDPLFIAEGGGELLTVVESLRRSEPFSEEDVRPEGLFDFLRRHRIAVPSGAPEPAREAPVSCSGGSQGKSAYLLLAHHCNQACVYCYNGAKTYRVEEKLFMTEAVARKALAALMSPMNRGERLDLVFFGGEPLLNWPLAKKIIAWCEPEKERLGIEVNYHLTTNLTIFPEDLIDYAEKYKIGFLVDIDGPEVLHDLTRPFRNGGKSFATSVKNIERLVKRGIPVALRATVTRRNQDRMTDIVKTHRELGGGGSALVALNPVDSDLEVLPIDLCPDPEVYGAGLLDVLDSGIYPAEEIFPFNEFLRRLRPGYRHIHSCGAPYGNTPVFDAEGRIYSCIYLVGNPRWMLGDLALEDFPRPEVVKTMLSVTEVDGREPCRSCDIRFLCGGGCPVGRFSLFGNDKAAEEIKRYARDIHCITARTVLTELFWRRAEMIEDVYGRRAASASGLAGGVIRRA